VNNAMSSFAWLDFSESDRQKALDVIDLFREKGTVDELGIGAVRDAFADLLFPGTSTIMTRARYYLFVPWMYQRHERKKTPSNEITQAARKDEIALIEALAKSKDIRGVIGIEARASLKRLPSTIYWQGLGQLGIRRYLGALEGYHRALDAFYRNGGGAVRGDDGHVITGGNLRNWDPALPAIPKGFPWEATLQLRQGEADYLRERIMQSAPHSLFAFLVDHLVDDSAIDFPWKHPLYPRMSVRNKSELQHARNFSETMHGAALLYNLMLGEKKKDEERVKQYTDLFDDWAVRMSGRMAELEAWSRSDFWALVRATGARLATTTKDFISTWLDNAIAKNPGALPASKTARDLIVRREHVLKGPLARLENAHALGLWGGASSSGRLDYRWNRPVKSMLADMRNALEEP
jgi:hypothetical protein